MEGEGYALRSKRRGCSSPSVGIDAQRTGEPDSTSAQVHPAAAPRLVPPPQQLPSLPTLPGRLMTVKTINGPYKLQLFTSHVKQ